MDRKTMWKWVILAVLVILSVMTVTVDFHTWKWVGPREKIKLGLDLSGGTSLTVEIDEAALAASIAEEHKRQYGTDLTDVELKSKLDDALRDAIPRAKQIIRNRVDELGTKEPLITSAKGSNRILIQLPGADAKDRDKIIELIRKVAFLSFHIVHRDNGRLSQDLMADGIKIPGYRIIEVGGKSYYVREKLDEKAAAELATIDPRQRFAAAKAPVGYMFLLERRYLEEQRVEVFEPCCVKRRHDMTGEVVTDARAQFTPMGKRDVSLTFNKDGSSKFYKLTRDYGPRGEKNKDRDEGYQVAIVLDYVVFSAPVIREAIQGGKASISGNFPGDEADRLAMVLRTGALPAPVKVVEIRTVDPTLGKDSIHSGFVSTLMGLAGVVVFMILYYRMAGLVANVGLTFNLILLPLGMIITGGFMGLLVDTGTGRDPFALPVLTMPGIAGIVLTLGMAVDANVLIFERMREEFQTGKRFWTAVLAGYDRAFLAIFDSNITTILSGIILFYFGTGPVRGFAVTLCAGIVVSLFTALTVTKLFFGILAATGKFETLGMAKLIKDTTIDFISKRKIAITASLIVIVGSWAFAVFQGIKDPARVLSVDFISGTSLTFQYKEKAGVDEVRAALESAGVAAPQIQYQRSLDDSSKEFLLVSTAFRDGEKAKLALSEKFPQAGYTLTKEDAVDPQVGSEIAKNALLALIFSLIGMIIYISFRFEFGFALGAIVALVHDVLITAGVYALLGRQLSATVVASLLTIIGFSVNDTIVIFDRIRENLRLHGGKSFIEIANLSVNQTLSRTILTTLTVLITVLVLLVFGGGALNDFALSMIIGVVAGTYSTIYIATPIVLMWHKGKRPDLGSSQKAS